MLGHESRGNREAAKRAKEKREGGCLTSIRVHLRVPSSFPLRCPLWLPFYFSAARARLTHGCARKPRWQGRGGRKIFGFFVTHVARLTHAARNRVLTCRCPTPSR